MQSKSGMKAVPVSIPLHWGTLRALHWPRPGAPRVLCLHGWLDNAASFIPLAPYLDRFDLLALDFAGHGLSDHRPEASRYYLPENIFDVDAVLDVLGWDRCNLVGHSMGGGVASGLASALPDRVNRLVMLDTVGILSQRAENAANQLQQSVLSVRKRPGRLRPYNSIEAAMQARQKDASLTDDAARLLCERALEFAGKHFQWRTDPRLRWRSPWLLTDQQAINLLTGIESPTLVITSPTAVKYMGVERLKERLAAIQDCRHLDNDGHHHFHMEQPGLVGAQITDFLLQPNPSN